MSVAQVLAHQGGWDEILMIVGPIVAIIGLIAVAKRKMNKEKVAESVQSEKDELVSFCRRADQLTTVG